jgi:hypothetical protein
MKSNSKTPRTDSAASETIIGIYHEPNFVDADFARELELENAELLASLSAMCGKYGEYACEDTETAEQLIENIKRKLTKKSND